MTAKLSLTFCGRISMAEIKQVVLKHYSKNDCILIDKVIGNNLRVARQNAGYTQSQVMDMIWDDKKNRNRISEIENGKVTIDIYTFLILVDLYGQSVDFILGRSCEPINDVMAASVNNVKLNLQKYLEPIFEKATETVIEHIKSIDKDDNLELLKVCDDIGHYTFANGLKLAQDNPELYKLLHNLMNVTRKIRINEAKRERQMYAQLEAIEHRHDKEDGHLLMSDLLRKQQYTLPLPEPRSSVVSVKDGE